MEPVPLPLGLSLKVGDVIDQDGDRLAEGVAFHPSEVKHGSQQESESLPTVAALYVDPNGVYANLPGVEVWDEARDARLYAGPWPVVAHPPCQRWCQLAPLNESRLGDGYRVGDDGGCFAAALEAVRRFGGVLEHPAYSLAWAAFDLPRPERGYWSRSLFDEGWVTELSQSAYGHECRKRTWLYYVGDEPVLIDYAEPEVHAQVSAFGRHARTRPLGELDKGKSNYTPASFRDVLLSLAAARRG